MPPGLPHRPPLAMKLWLSQHFGRGGGTTSSSASPGHSSGIAMSIESLEHLVRSRVRMFLRHTWLVTILGTILLGVAVWLAFYFTTQAEVMRIAAGPPGSSNEKLVQVLSQKFVKEHDNILLELVATNGAKESIQALSSGKADLAIVPTTVGNSPDWPVIAILRQNVMALIVPAPSTRAPKKGKQPKAVKLEKVSQLAGHSVGIVTGSEATPDLLDVVLNHYGVPAGKVQVSLIDPKDLADSIHNNLVDVVFVAGAATGQAITDAVAAASHNTDAPTFIEIDQADGIAARNIAFDKADIDAGTFGGNPPAPDDSLKSLSFAEYLVARKSFSHSGITLLAKIIYTSRLAIAAQMAGEIKIEAPSTEKDANVLVHQGALDYLNDNQQSFFDKYGDDIFYGLLIFPIFGSAIAGVASYLRSDGRTRRLRLLQRLLELVRKAHGAQTLEAIDQLQVETDNLVVAVIHQCEHEDPEQSVQLSYSIALEQVRFALAARRAVILERGSAGTQAAAA
jgi:TRAP-type uncharacterized transport system substrate-binding protein